MTYVHLGYESIEVHYLLARCRLFFIAFHEAAFDVQYGQLLHYSDYTVGLRIVRQYSYVVKYVLTPSAIRRIQIALRYVTKCFLVSTACCAQ